MTSPLFSIIIPCYNTAEYVGKCIESIKAQTFKEFEAVLIDDGSTDETYSVCLQMISGDDRFHIFSQPNGGLSNARNTGIRESCGRFVIFLDSDDFIEPTALEIFKSVIDDQTEIIITRFIEDYGNEIRVRDNEMEAYLSGKGSVEAAVQWIMTKSDNTWPAQKYIVSKEFIVQKGLLFPEGYLHEDLDWTTRLFAEARHISVSYTPWYHHRMERQGSITNVPKAKRIADVIELAYGLIDGENAVIKDYSISCRQMVLDRIMKSVFQTLVRYRDLPSKEDRDAVVECAEKYRIIFRNQPKTRYRFFMLAVNLMGFQKALQLYSFVAG